MARCLRVLAVLALLVATPLSFAPDRHVVESRVCAREGPSAGTCKFSPDEACTYKGETMWDYYWKD
jgi:hypothetical protein